MAFRWRSLPLGNRAFTTTTDTRRYLAALEGPLGFLSQWDYRLGASRASSKGKSVLNNGYVYTVPFVNLINTGVVDPFSYTQTPEAMAAIDKVRANGVALYGGTYRTDALDAGATGPLFTLPAGTVQAAVGLDWRQEQFLFSGDSRTNLSSSDALIFNAPFDNGLATNGALKRTIKAAFVELQVPIIKGLDLNLAGRTDNYTGFGSSTNPKVTLRYTLNEAILFRSSYSTGFRVPTFKQQFDPVTVNPIAATGLIDPGTGRQIAAELRQLALRRQARPPARRSQDVFRRLRRAGEQAPQLQRRLVERRPHRHHPELRHHRPPRQLQPLPRPLPP
jgi:iron complex outermembrane receptor protein